ncbi:ComEC/Rec2 family competence protein [Mesorhizobium sp.]|uniref:ComEC/Rec2 family competence protein n=1 Tax=Mesorhizobium sp. TaxID=1871066 RepID=UPI000FE7B811|nr:MBL fold metallo-hydrolase [Mesorhizobium sp.]RWP51074.1 MAG: metallohydrolase [Mesorhizobium sp.]
MADKFLIRAFDVGLGDCIYCGIPGAATTDGKPDTFHMLIDCGSWSGMPYLQVALKNLARLLPDVEGGRKRLDLVVVTHEHKDHIAGFDPALFADFRIGAIWMNAAMNPDHAQAKKSMALHGIAASAMRGLAASGFAESPEIQDLVSLLNIDNDGAMTSLRQTIPASSGIKARYVHAGQTNDDLALPLNGKTKIHVLGPEEDIDRFYLGKNVEKTLRGMAAATPQPEQPAVQPPEASSVQSIPTNISAAEFRQLRSRMLSSALAFAELSSKVTNNTSVVLLIEWESRRLLFVGDAEWDAGFREGKSNGAWNVMWNRQPGMLQEGIDFLKVGHHGSENATPWNDQQDGKRSEPGDILDAILPLPDDGQQPSAMAVVSTERGKYRTIPRAALLTELGRRVASTRRYKDGFAAHGLDVTSVPKFDEFERSWIDAPQPLRTDFERLLDAKGYVDIEISAKAAGA